MTSRATTTSTEDGVTALASVAEPMLGRPVLTPTSTPATNRPATNALASRAPRTPTGTDTATQRPDADRGTDSLTKGAAGDKRKWGLDVPKHSALLRAVLEWKPSEQPHGQQGAAWNATIEAFNNEMNSLVSAWKDRDVAYARRHLKKLLHFHDSPEFSEPGLPVAFRKLLREYVDVADEADDDAVSTRVTRSVGVSEPMVINPGSDALLLRFALDERPYLAHEENAQELLYDVVANKLDKRKVWRFTDAQSVRTKLLWLVEVFKNENHPNHSSLPRDLREMLKEYAAVQMHNLKAALETHNNQLRREKRIKSKEVVTYVDVLLRGVLQYLPGNSVARLADKKWTDLLVDQINRDLGTPVFSSGSGCKEWFRKLRDAVSKPIRDASVRLTPGQVELLKQIQGRANVDGDEREVESDLIVIEGTEDEDDDDTPEQHHRRPHTPRNSKRRFDESTEGVQNSGTVPGSDQTRQQKRARPSESSVQPTIPVIERDEHEDQSMEVSETTTCRDVGVGIHSASRPRIDRGVTVPLQRHGQQSPSPPSETPPADQEPCVELVAGSREQRHRGDHETTRKKTTKGLEREVAKLKQKVTAQQTDITTLLAAKEKADARERKQAKQIEELFHRIEAMSAEISTVRERSYVQQEVMRTQYVEHIANCRLPTAAEFAALRNSLFGFADSIQGFYERRVPDASGSDTAEPQISTPRENA